VEVILLRWEATLSKTERKSQGQLGDEHRRKRRILARFQQSYVALRTFEQGNPTFMADPAGLNCCTGPFPLTGGRPLYERQ
jgi:hypothetical protein